MLLTIPLVTAQVPGSRTSADDQSKRLAGLSSWLVALDGFLADSYPTGSSLEIKPEAAYKTWVKWSPASKLPSGSTRADQPDSPDLMDTPESPAAETSRLFRDSAQRALDELAMVSFGTSSREDGRIQISHLPVFASSAAALLSTQGIETLAAAAELHNGANPLRVLLSFLASLSIKDREAFRLLAGIELEVVFTLLDISEMQSRPALDSGFIKNGFGTSTVDSIPAELLDAERLLVSWRSSRLRAARYQQGSLSHAVARAETGKYLAGLLAGDYGARIFNPGWAGEPFAQDARLDLAEAWSAIGRAVAIDLRREAAPWLARRLGTSGNPSFNLEYTVRPSPSNPFLALMTMRAIVNGVSHGIPYQIASRSLASAAAAYFDDAPVPIRYVEEPLPGLRIYVARDAADSSRAISELAADLSSAYPAALRVPSLLVDIEYDAESSCEEVCMALDGAYREAAAGARLARSFTLLLHNLGYTELAPLILHQIPGTMEVDS